MSTTALPPPDPGYCPVNFLPVEILAKAFLLVVLPEGMLLPYDAKRCPWNIGGTCQLWREVLYSTPVLWTSLHLPWNRFNTKVAQSAQSSLYPKRLAEFLKNSKKHSLSFSVERDKISLEPHWHDQPQEVIKTWTMLWTLLIGECWRWGEALYTVDLYHSRQLLDELPQPFIFDRATTLVLGGIEGIHTANTVMRRTCRLAAVKTLRMEAQISWNSLLTATQTERYQVLESIIRAHPSLNTLEWVDNGELELFALGAAYPRLFNQQSPNIQH